jgi:vacuolar-type H+-ATPase subunit I/STV1
MFIIILLSALINESEREIEAEQRELERVEREKQAMADRRASAQANAFQVMCKDFFAQPQFLSRTPSLAV